MPRCGGLLRSAQPSPWKCRRRPSRVRWQLQLLRPAIEPDARVEASTQKCNAQHHAAISTTVLGLLARKPGTTTFLKMQPEATRNHWKQSDSNIWLSICDISMPSRSEVSGAGETCQKQARSCQRQVQSCQNLAKNCQKPGSSTFSRGYVNCPFQGSWGGGWGGEGWARPSKKAFIITITSN